MAVSLYMYTTSLWRVNKTVKCPCSGPHFLRQPPMMAPLVPGGGGGGGHYLDRCITPLITCFCKMYLDSRYKLHAAMHVSSLLSSPALPLTFENVFNIVKNVKNWRILGGHMYYDSSKLDDIQHRHVSDEACLKSIVEDFVGGGGQYKQPSWRAVIWSLYKANEIQLAEHIRSFAEPVQGTVANDECIASHTHTV